MSLDPACVVECLAKIETGDGPRRTFGAGYRISTNLVLTCSHLFKGRGQRAEYRVRGQAGTMTTTASLAADFGDRGADVALLRLADGHGWGEVVPARFGRVAGGTGHVPFRSIGWPRAAESAGRRESVELTGRLAPGSNLKSGLLKLYIQGPHPYLGGPSSTPWSGMSGAAVFSRSALVGVVREHLVELGVDQLDAEPVAPLLDDPQLRALLAGENAWSSPVTITPELPREERGPQLETKLAHSGPATILNFRSRSTPMVGRGGEMRQLREILGDDRPFCWQLLTGPGGSGKSRLALELCLEAADAGWHAGFLVPGIPFEWHIWLPARPTLIVVDEQEYRRDVIKEIITVLAARSDTLTERVRLLLLGREKSDRFEQSLGVDPTDWDAFYSDSAAGEPISLQPLSDTDSRRLAAEVAGSGVPHPWGGDVAFRLPLYAILAGIAGDAVGPQWDSHLASRYVLRRNRITYWGSMTPSDEAALVYACITRDPTDTLAHYRGLPEVAAVPWPTLLERNQEFTGTEAHGLTPLEPGPIGELFVLELLAASHDPAGTSDIGHRAAAAAFDLNAFANEFVLRCQLHFPEHTGLPRLIAVMVEYFDRGSTMLLPSGVAILEESAREYAADGGTALPFAQAEAVRLLERRPEAAFSLTIAGYGSILFELVTAFAKRGDWEATRQATQLLRQAAEEYARESGRAFALRLPSEVGRGYGNAILFTFEAGVTDLSATLFRELLALTQLLGPELDPYLGNAAIDAVKAEATCADGLQLARTVLAALGPGRTPSGVKDALFNVVNRAGREHDPATAIDGYNLMHKVWLETGEATPQDPERRSPSQLLMPLGS